MTERQIFDHAGDEDRKYLVGKPGGDLEIYADGIHGFSTANAVVKLNFYTRGFHSDGKTLVDGERREVAFRLVLPMPAFLSVAQFFQERAAEIKKQMELTPEDIKSILERAGQQGASGETNEPKE